MLPLNPLDFNLKHLRAVLAIRDQGSLSGAGGIVGLSQPALTQALLKLEAQLGFALFLRKPHGVEVTASGEAALFRVRRALDQFTAAFEAVMRRTGRVPEGRLTSAQVRALLGFADTGSFIGAAQLLNLSEPFVHRSIRSLEELAGISLVERRGRRTTLTGAGARLASGFSLAVAELSAALDIGPQRPNRLIIGAMALSRSVFIPAVLAELYKKSPFSNIEVIEGSYTDLAQFLRRGTLDIIVGALREMPAPDLRQKALFTDRLTIIGRAGHPLARRNPGHRELADYPWIVARRASQLLQRWQEMFDQASVPRPAAPIQCGSVATIRGVLLRSDFLTLLSEDQVRAEIDAGLLMSIKSQVPDTNRAIGAIMRRDWHPTALQEQFLAILNSVADSRV